MSQPRLTYRAILERKLEGLFGYHRPGVSRACEQLPDILSTFNEMRSRLLAHSNGNSTSLDESDIGGTVAALFSQYVNEIWVSEFPPRCQIDTLAVVDSLLEDDIDGALQALRASDIPQPDTLLTRLINLRNACRHLFGANFLAHREESLSAELVKAVHAIAMAGDPIAGPGQYRTKHVHAAGSTVVYALPSKISSRLDTLIEFTNQYLAASHDDKVKQFVICVLFFSEFLLIHPFRDGNGRTARLVTGHLMRAIVPVPMSLFYRDRETYIRVLEARNMGEEPQRLVDFFIDCAGNMCFVTHSLLAD